MLSLFKTDTVYPLEDLYDAVAAQIHRIPEIVSPQGETRGVLRFEFPTEPINGFVWLHNQKAGRKFYWANRDQSFSMAGIGIADEISSSDFEHIHDIFATMEDNLSSENPLQRYYGGVSFQPQIHSREWQAYHSIYFAIPQFEIVNTNDQSIFAFNIALKDITHDYIQQVLKNLSTVNFDALTVYRNVPQVLKRIDEPNKEQWHKMFAAIKDNKNALKYDKIVLARKSQFQFDIPIKPEALLKHLADITPNCYHFDLQIEPFRGFIGASPEQLFSLSHRTLTTEAVAGTCPRGTTEEEDNQLAAELLVCEKNSNEHKFVVDQIQSHLNPLCENLTRDTDSSLIKLQNNQHLVTHFKGTIKPDINAADVLKTLHPTPAVGGVPYEGISEAIRNIEPFDRGWYAAPIGYVGYENSEFAVGIRSALIEQEMLSLYAGAGVVQGSTEEDEWDEIETKIGNFLKVFSQ